MPELGKYAAEVISAYLVSVILIVGLVVFSLRRSSRIRAALREVESRRPKTDG